MEAGPKFVAWQRPRDVFDPRAGVQHLFTCTYPESSILNRFALFGPDFCWNIGNIPFHARLHMATHAVFQGRSAQGATFARRFFLFDLQRPPPPGPVRWIDRIRPAIWLPVRAPGSGGTGKTGSATAPFHPIAWFRVMAP